MNTESNRSHKELLLQLTDQQLSQTDFTPPAVFLANLVVVLFSVLKVNGSVNDTKIEQLLKALDRFTSLNSNEQKLTHSIVKKLSYNAVLFKEFTKPSRVSKLTELHDQQEKLLLIGLSYSILLTNGTMDERENHELHKYADWIGINSQHIAVLEAGFGFPRTIEPAALTEVQSLLKEDQFGDLGNSFVSAASDLLAVLSTKFNPSEIPASPKQTQVLKKIPPNAKPSDIFPWEPPKSKDSPKSPISGSFEDGIGRAHFD